MKKINKNLGFTLLEMIVATAIFAIVSTICIGIYLATIKANAKISAMQKIQNEIRYNVDYISREIRLGSINYDYYNNIENPESVLALYDNSKNTIFFRKNNKYIQTSSDNITWNDLSGDNVDVRSLYFYISPIKDPKKLSVSTTKQELVTIVMEVFDKNLESSIKIQTTVSSRNYKR